MNYSAVNAPSVVGLTGTNDALIVGPTSLDINPTYFPISDIIWTVAYMCYTEHLQ